MTPARRSILALVVLAPAALLGCATRVDAPPRSVVFFTNLSTAIDPPGVQVIDEVAADAKAHPGTQVYVSGFADANAAGSATASLSGARAQMVADALVARSVPRRQITIRPRSSAGADPGIESRRVDISFGR